MSTERKEPVITSEALELTDRVRLTWREVRELADASGTTSKPSEIETAAASAADTRPLTEEEMKAIALMIAPAVENAVKVALRDTLEVSLQNASTRIRADLERSVAGVVSNSVRTELARIEIETK